MRYIYIVKCKDNSLYTGIAKDYKKRINDHNTSKVGAKYTKSRRPVVLVWKKKVVDVNTAMKLEYTIKRFSREKKEELIAHPRMRLGI